MSGFAAGDCTLILAWESRSRHLCNGDASTGLTSATPGGFSTIADGATANPPGVADTRFARSSTRRRTPLHQRQSRRQSPDEVRLPPWHLSPLTPKCNANASLSVDRYRTDIHQAGKGRGAHTPAKWDFASGAKCTKCVLRIGYTESVWRITAHSSSVKSSG
ncbi:hypothetical protein FHS27_004777 [Rhodopirellula rubra]|uniref:Uncharacterized protein n=1 Tax=Aporhodopirellula rubra TaxID=980271 RepID=A0A7W5H7Z9_9BACT|nr:hypothetical protein [Aporhodopirellula rubra]